MEISIRKELARLLDGKPREWTVVIVAQAALLAASVLANALERVRKLPNVETLFGHEVTGVTQNGGAISVEVKGLDGIRLHSGANLIGADGGNSVAPQESDIAFDGFACPERFSVLTAPFDFRAASGHCYHSYFSDPDEWYNCFKVSADGPPGLGCTVYPTNPAMSEEELMSDAAVQARMQKFFPADKLYEIVHRNLYVTHQRVTATVGKGRVLLVGDSAHVNDSIGGMGLNGGVQDAADLSKKLAQVLLDCASDAPLDLYSLLRRTVAMGFVREQSVANKKRLEARDPETRRRNPGELSEIAAEPARARQFLLRASMIASQRRVASLSLTET